MTWMTPLDWKTSAVVTVAMPPLASVSMIWLPDMVAVRSSPWTVLKVTLPPPFLIRAASAEWIGYWARWGKETGREYC